MASSLNLCLYRFYVRVASNGQFRALPAGKIVAATAPLGPMAAPRATRNGSDLSMFSAGRRRGASGVIERRDEALLDGVAVAHGQHARHVLLADPRTDQDRAFAGVQ